MTKHFGSIAALTVALSVAMPALALDTPRPSPFAKVVQTVGLTDITVDYSSPAVAGRPIWGALVPYGEVWRAGANMATKVTFSKDVTVGTTAVPAGSYAFFVIPAAKGPWTLIINKDFNQGGAFNYKKELDVVRVDVTPEAIPHRERLAYTLANFTDESATLDLEWEKLKVSLPIKLATESQVKAGLQAAEDSTWEPYNAVGNYYRQVRKDNATAIANFDKSIKIKETWQNLWGKAQSLHEEGKNKDAHALAVKAQQVGKDAPKFFTDEVAKAIANWK